ncbi:hypothetical protein Baya_1908 [Bagarius yarrelli]|uniref:Uncharacterized protein n=1 Tax=Bagarius yarrelli TaxID=175774 RepID=A0A556TMG0_BAGYA|nr:hypothetical protein Baya_1908 [Bagarius yarrelli]
MYGDQLSIRLSSGAEKLLFTSADETKQDVLWTRSTTSKRGTVTGKNDDRRFVINSVTFDDEGIYTVINFWNRKSAIYLLKVITKSSSQNCVVGESLSIYLSGLPKNEAKLNFSSEDFNLTLVERGLPVGNLHPDYMGRIQVTSNSIEVLNVNVSDVGNYTLSDHLNRKVKIVSMNLVDHHPGISAGPLTALLLLLGIPPCICCCCRKRIFKKSSQPTTSTTTVKYDNQINPPGPPPAYDDPPTPAGPSPSYTPGYPAAPSPMFPPQQPYSGYPVMPPNPNPLYPPMPGFSPAQPPQWSGTPGNIPAPAGFAPVMYDAPVGPEPVKGELPTTTPLLTPPQPESFFKARICRVGGPPDSSIVIRYVIGWFCWKFRQDLGFFLRLLNNCLYVRLFSLTKRGRVTGSSSDSKFVIDSVNYEDQGTYTLYNFWNQKISIHLLKVVAKRSTQNCVVGESLSIYLSGIPKNEATLHFLSEDFNLTLVERGLPVGNLHPDYMGRIQVTSDSIEVLNVNVSDVGNYTLSDRLNRKVKIVSMNLVDHHEELNAAPLTGLLILLGIPPCVFCCYKKKICKKNSQPTTSVNTSVKCDEPIIPPGPPPAYTSFVGPTPAVPTPAYSPGYPESIVHPPPNPTFPPQQPYNGDPATSPAMPFNPGYSTGYPAVDVHPPPNPTFPPQHPYTGDSATSPAMPPNPPYNSGYPAAPWFPPAQPPHSGVSNQPASAGFSPVVYNAHVCPEPVKGDIPPTTPLLTPAPNEGYTSANPAVSESIVHLPPNLTFPSQQPYSGDLATSPAMHPNSVPQPPSPYTGTDMLHSSKSAVQFNINMGKDSSVNFL